MRSRYIGKLFLELLLFIGASLFLKDALIGLWYNIVAMPMFGAINASTLYDVLSIGILSALAVWSVSCSHRMSKRLWWLFGIYTLFYLELRVLGSAVYQLVPFNIKSLHCAKYADIVPVAMLVYGITSLMNKRTSVQENITPERHYFEDGTDVEDLLGHRKDAETLAGIVRNDYAHNENAVGIAITGEWGAGKSTFLGYLDESLADCINIKFDPWTENSTDVVSDLLDKIEIGIKKENVTLARVFRHYLNKVNMTNITGWFDLSLLAIRNFFDPGNGDEQRQNIINALKGLEKPVVIFIDDSDRLPSDQFLKIISIIRGIVDLPNVVFVVAFDQMRANEKLKDYGGEDFMRKLFNVIHHLQPIDEEIIINELSENISIIICEEKRDVTHCKRKVRETFSELPIKRYLPTLREMKRFCNVIEKDYSLIKGSKTNNFLDSKQWLTTELLKYTDIAVYTMMAANPKTYLTTEKQFGLNSPYYVLKDDATFWKQESRELLSYLFHSHRGQQNNTFQINNPCYFRLYFDRKFPDDYIPMAVFEKYAIFKHDNDESTRMKTEALKTFIHENWHSNNTSNIESIVCEILKTYPVDLLYPMLEVIVLEYMAHRGYPTLKELAEQDDYRKYSAVIREHPFIAVLSFNTLYEFCEYDGHKAANDDCILKSAHPLILCALFNEQIKNWDYDGRIGSDGYLFALLRRLISEGKHQDIIWAVADCVSADLKKSFLNDYLQSHLLDCLPYMICTGNDDATGKKLIYADIPAFESLFLSYKGFKSALSNFKWEGIYNDDLLDELRRLVELSNLSKYPNEYFKAESYPLLTSYVGKNQRVLSESYLKSDTFWSDRDRIEDVIEYQLV